MTPTQAFERLPSSIRVGGYTFQLERMTPAQTYGRGASGEFRPAEGVIAIYAGSATVWRLVDTFFHEVCHAIEYVYGIQDDDKEERRVSTMGTALMALFRDNPWLSGWLGELLQESMPSPSEYFAHMGKVYRDR